MFYLCYVIHVQSFIILAFILKYSEGEGAESAHRPIQSLQSPAGNRVKWLYRWTIRTEEKE